MDCTEISASKIWQETVTWTDQFTINSISDKEKTLCAHEMIQV